MSDKGMMYQAMVAGLADAIAEIMTGRPTAAEKAVFLAQVPQPNRPAGEMMYQDAVEAFKKDSRNSVQLFFWHTVTHLDRLPDDNRASGEVDNLVSVLGAAERLGYLSDGEAANLIAKARWAGRVDR